MQAQVGVPERLRARGRRAAGSRRAGPARCALRGRAASARRRPGAGASRSGSQRLERARCRGRGARCRPARSRPSRAATAGRTPVGQHPAAPRVVARSLAGAASVALPAACRGAAASAPDGRAEVGEQQARAAKPAGEQRHLAAAVEVKAPCSWLEPIVARSNTAFHTSPSFASEPWVVNGRRRRQGDAERIADGRERRPGDVEAALQAGRGAADRSRCRRRSASRRPIVASAAAAGPALGAVGRRQPSTPDVASSICSGSLRYWPVA